jgi:hypothetical protein
MFPWSRFRVDTPNDWNASPSTIRVHMTGACPALQYGMSVMNSLCALSVSTNNTSTLTGPARSYPQSAAQAWSAACRPGASAWVYQSQLTKPHSSPGLVTFFAFGRSATAPEAAASSGLVDGVERAGVGVAIVVGDGDVLEVRCMVPRLLLPECVVDVRWRNAGPAPRDYSRNAGTPQVLFKAVHVQQIAGSIRHMHMYVS